MNCQQARETITLTAFLSSINYEPVKIKGKWITYYSPIRSDENPSFFVDTDKNIWHDKGTGQSGDIVNLVMKINAVNSTGALTILQKGVYATPSFISIKQETNQPAIEIKHVQPLQNQALIQYLNYRKISQQNAAKFVLEAHYTVNEKQYFSVAFKNDKGGFELRNKHFKNSSSPKAITTISGNRKSINIFEGFIDFLSALEYYKVTKTEVTSIILNSVNNLDSVINNLTDYQQINLFLDNDTAGNQATEKIKSIYPKAKDYSKIIYPGHKDFNEFICKNPIP
jgi:DNA primase